MGPQPSTLNCKIDQTDKQNQIKATKQFAIKAHKNNNFKTQPDTNQTEIHTQNVIGVKSSRNQLTRATSQKSLSVKASRQQLKNTKLFIPQHQSITKVSENVFKNCIKQRKFYGQEKIKSLGQIVQARYNTPKHFPYSQIIGLTETLVYSLAYLTKKKCNHHDFYPTNIYYIDGKFKVINPLQLPCTGFYLTSQKEVSQKDVGQEIMAKSDVFAIGMILLETCSLQPSSECYDEESYNIVDSVIKERIGKIARIYTPNMAQCINMMLQYQIDARIQPLRLAQFIHSRIDQQKNIAIQMETPKPQSPVPNIQNVPQNMNMMRPGPPGNINQPLPPPLVARGPPPPYSHQPFRMQNLNPNVIAVSMPNETFTRISPNNQGFLSSSSLQQKLRVIELIKQNPNQQDSQNQHESVLQPVRQKDEEQKKNITQKNSHQNISNLQQIKSTTTIQNQPIRPQYPFVESIYSQKPLHLQRNQNQFQRRMINNNIGSNNLQNQTLNVRTQQQKYLSSQPQFNQYLGQRMNTSQPQLKQTPKIMISQPQFKQINNQRFSQNINIDHKNKKIYPQQPYQQPRQIPQTYSNQPPQYQNRQSPYIQNNRTTSNYGYSVGYGTAISPRAPIYMTTNSTGNTINKAEIASLSQQNYSSSLSNQYNLSSNNVKTVESYNSVNKYGTSYENKTNNNQRQQGQQSLQQRVQRVLNMSKNIK